MGRSGRIAEGLIKRTYAIYTFSHIQQVCNFSIFYSQTVKS
uniref:Uncharacterized protein n=1 Tax=Arundo donax TaxID=35708 RepID=A0A0A9HLK1_ARUDO